MLVELVIIFLGLLAALYFKQTRKCPCFGFWAGTDKRWRTMNVLFAIIVIFRLRLLCGCCEEIILQRYRRLNYCFEAPPRKPSFNPKNHQLQQKFKCWWIKIRILKLNILAELAIRHFSNNLSWNSKGGWEISERVDTIRKLARWNRVRTARVALKIPRRRDNSSKDVLAEW